MYHMDLAKDTEPVKVFVNKSPEEVCAMCNKSLGLGGSRQVYLLGS